MAKPVDPGQQIRSGDRITCALKINASLCVMKPPAVQQAWLVDQRKVLHLNEYSLLSVDSEKLRRQFG
ncbi:MAG: hypothetical protein ACKO45_15870 [Cyanobium sp.]